MLMIIFFLYCSLFSRRGSSLVVKYAHHQINDLCFRKTKTITAFIPNLVFVLLFVGIDKIWEMIETFYDSLD